MITRRNIRVKVMQVLYQLDSTGNISDNEAIKMLDNRLEQTPRLFTYLIYFLTEVARYAEKDASQRASKHLATAEDKNVNTKLSGNTVLWAILENHSYRQAMAKYRFCFDTTEELVRSTYEALVPTEKYKQYIHLQNRDIKMERDMLTYIFSDLMLPEENFVAHIEENFTNWDDDAEMLNVLMLNELQKPSVLNLQQMPDAEKKTFAKELLQTAISKKDHVAGLIKARLKNWDPERIAVLDMILMQMGVCEFLYFPTIPPKVTINEYIDLAKDYSTAQSGHFVNGILDGIHKDLVAQNKIYKTDFKSKKAN
ncbi:transcription antitermination factor NusB [Parafilimonas sp.]|uniref:transcription antitermination factor NusB n=1 Tax=Parafilimonas sp. TaxID=1969739 RepID=UPI0039E6E787